MQTIIILKNHKSIHKIAIKILNLYSHLLSLSQLKCLKGQEREP